MYKFIVLTSRTGNCAVRAHKAAELSTVVIGTHEQFALVLVAAGIAGCWLRGSRQPLKIELVRVPLSMHFCHYVLVVVIPETKAIRYCLATKTTS